MEPSAYAFPDRFGGPVGSLVTDGVQVFATILGASPDILRFSESAAAASVVPDAGPAGPLVLANGRLAWLTNAGELRSASSGGGVYEQHGTFAGATNLATDGACYYVATPTGVVAVAATGTSQTRISPETVVDLTASSAGVFWATSNGNVEGIWR
jgi:hypothetical protein